jgi:hypothetical protein
LGELGYSVAAVSDGERLVPHYLAGDFAPIIAFCGTAQAFKDVPFSLPGTFVHLDRHFRGAKFILTVRDSPDQWYRSLVTAHSEMFGGGHLPTEQDLRDSTYAYPGFMWDVQGRVIAGLGHPPYDRSALIDFYESHNAAVRERFRGRNDLLEINLADPASYLALCRFLGKAPVAKGFPHLNRGATH